VVRVMMMMMMILVGQVEKRREKAVKLYRTLAACLQLEAAAACLRRLANWKSGRCFHMMQTSILRAYLPW
jgi:hypothetical protein